MDVQLGGEGPKGYTLTVVSDTVSVRPSLSTLSLSSLSCVQSLSFISDQERCSISITPACSIHVPTPLPHPSPPLTTNPPSPLCVQVFMQLAGLVEVSKEVAKLDKKLAAVMLQLTGLAKKMDAPSYAKVQSLHTFVKY